MSAARLSHREQFPATAAIVDEFRNAFGDGVKVTFAEESGRTVGKPLDERKYRVICGADLVIAAKKVKL